MNMQKTGRYIATAAFSALLLAPALHSPVLAQPVPAVKQDDPHSLAHAFLVKASLDKQLDSVVLATHDILIVTLKRRGITDENAAVITDRYMMPEFRAREPELMGRFEDVMVTDFTVPELRAMVNRDDPNALRSAQAKAGQMPAHFQTAGEAWGRQVGEDAYAKNKAGIDRLGGGVLGATP